MHRTCVKCGHGHAAATGGDLEACPNCGAVYAKAMPTRASPVPRGAPMSGFGGAGALSTRPPEDDAPAAPAAPVGPSARARVVEFIDAPAGGPRTAFVTRMRSESLYPTFRGAVNAVYSVMTGLAVLIAGGVCVSGVLDRNSSFGIGSMVGALVFALLLWLFARVCKEGSLMLADLCDASVRAASAAER